MALYLPWLTFFIGVFVGWLLTWLIMTGNKRDLETQVVQLQGSLRAREAELAGCRDEAAAKEADYKGRIKTLETDLKACRAELTKVTADLDARRGELETVVVRVGELEEELERLSAASAVTRSSIISLEEETEVDDFTQIKGIGPALAARLSAAGIYRYADLAKADPAELPDALGIQPWQKAEPELWVAEAAVLAERPAQVQVGDDLTLLEGIGPSYARRLRAAGIISFEQLSNSDEETLAVIIGVSAWRRPLYGDWIAQARLAAAGDEEELRILQDRLFSRQGDNLALVSGVGSQSAQVLHDGGIETYAALGAAKADDLAVLFIDADVRAGDFDAWIAEAKLRAAGKRVQRSRARLPQLEGAMTRSCPQDLELIEGIGTVYEQRLYEVGVGTYWEVGMLSELLLSEILEVQDFQDVDLSAIQADALRLAAETESMGFSWDGSEPDNFEPLEGIGVVLERRLYAAGICTYEALARATVKQLEEICHVPEFQQPDYGRWIAQARELMS